MRGRKRQRKKDLKRLAETMDEILRHLLTFGDQKRLRYLTEKYPTPLALYKAWAADLPAEGYLP